MVNLDDPEDVQVEDVDEEEDEEDGYNGNEMTENTPEDRVKVNKHSTFCTVQSFFILFHIRSTKN